MKTKPKFGLTIVNNTYQSIRHFWSIKERCLIQIGRKYEIEINMNKTRVMKITKDSRNSTEYNKRNKVDSSNGLLTKKYSFTGIYI